MGVDERLKILAEISPEHAHGTDDDAITELRLASLGDRCTLIEFSLRTREPAVDCFDNHQRM